MRVENREKSSPTDGADQGMRTGRALSSLKLRKNRQRVSPGHVNRRFNAVLAAQRVATSAERIITTETINGRRITVQRNRLPFAVFVG